jgi:thymidylate kinase
MTLAEPPRTIATHFNLDAEAGHLRTTLERCRPGRAFFVEFAGTPKAGKTTTLTGLESFFREHGYRVDVVTEGAARCPLKGKLEPTYNVWTACSTLVDVLAAHDRDNQVVLIDRGFFDALCWLHWFNVTKKLSDRNHRAIHDFLLLSLWRQLIDLVFVMKVKPEKAIERRYGRRAPQVSGRIMNNATLSRFNASVSATKDAHLAQFQFVEIDTSDRAVAPTMDLVKGAALEGLERFLRTMSPGPTPLTDLLSAGGASAAAPYRI